MNSGRFVFSCMALLCLGRISVRAQELDTPASTGEDSRLVAKLPDAGQIALQPAGWTGTVAQISPGAPAVFTLKSPGAPATLTLSVIDRPADVELTRALLVEMVVAGCKGFPSSDKIAISDLPAVAGIGVYAVFSDEPQTKEKPREHLVGNTSPGKYHYAAQGVYATDRLLVTFRFQANDVQGAAFQQALALVQAIEIMKSTRNEVEIPERGRLR